VSSLSPFSVSSPPSERVPGNTSLPLLPRTFVAGLADRIGETVCIKGWLHHQRALKAVDFLLLRDATGIAQVVVEDPDVRDIAHSLPHESVLAITALVVASSQAPNGVELHEP